MLLGDFGTFGDGSTTSLKMKLEITLLTRA